jgi:hypothetical protein
MMCLSALMVVNAFTNHTARERPLDQLIVTFELAFNGVAR